MKNLLKSILMLVLFSSAIHAQQITGVAPLKGPAGTVVTISGSGFSQTASENVVFFGKSKGNVISVNSAGTELKVNTPVNPTYPSNISVYNTSTDGYIESRFAFYTSFAARINPENRDIEDQFQTLIEPDQDEFEGDYITNSTQNPYIHGSDILVVSDISNDGSMDFINQYESPYYNQNGITMQPVNVFVNENPLFALSAPINSSTVVNPAQGFTKYEGYNHTNTSAHPNGLDYPDIITAGYLLVDLNNDGEDDFVNYGCMAKSAANASFQVLVNNASNTFDFEAEDANIFSFTDEGGQDWGPNVVNSAHVSFAETIAMEAKAADMDGDGKKDLVFLLSYPKNMSKGSSVDRKQIFILRNITTPGSTTITFSKSNNYTSALPSQIWSPGTYVGMDAAIGITGNSWSGLPTSNIDFITDFDLGDLNADGKMDIVFKGISRPASSITLDDTTASGQINQASSIPNTAATGGTGFVQYVINNSTWGSLSFGSPTAINGAISMNDVEDWGGITVADLDVDGDLDIIAVASTKSGSSNDVDVDLKLFRNDGALSFSETTMDGPSGPNYWIAQIKVADLNGDELPDVLCSISKTGEMTAFMQKQSTASSALSSSSFGIKSFTYPYPGIEDPLGVSIADFSNDGKVDLVIQETGNESRVIYLKNDDGLPQIYTNIQLANFVKCTGQNSEVQTFQIGGQTISKTDGRFIVVTAPAGWEVSKDPNTLSYKDTVRYYPNTNNEVMPAKTVSIRMKTTANDLVYSGDLEISTFNASTIAVPLKGSLNIPSYSGISPNVQYVNTTNSASLNGSTIPSPSPAATSSPVAVELSDVNGTVEWQKSSDKSTWTDIIGATDETYTLPDADLNAEGIVYLRAQISVCSATTNTNSVAILENLGVPAPPVFSASNGQTLSGTYDASLATQLSIYDNTNTAIATCSDLSGSTTCPGWSFVNGTFTYTPSSSYSDGDAFYAIAGNSAGGASQSSVSVVVDATAPGTPVITANTNGSSVSGTAEAGSTVTLSLNNAGTITTVDVVAAANGTWSYVPVPEIANGVVISAIATDAVGNQSSASTSVTVDAEVPTNTPTYADADGDGLTDGTTVDGTTEPGAVVTVTMPNGDVYTTTADATTGVYSITVSGTTTSDGDELSITIEDAAGNEMPTATYTVDKTAPTANIYATDGTSFSGVLDGEGYTVSLEYGSPASTQSLTVTGSSFDWTPSSSLGLSAADQVTYTISDEVGNETTYTITVQAEVYCIPAHSTGLDIGELTFKPGVLGASDVTFSTFLSDTYSDRTTTTTIELQHDAKPEFFLKPPSNITFYYQIWVDYNQNGDFSDNGEAIDGSSSSKNLIGGNSNVFHSWTDISVTNPLPDVPFEDLPDGSEYIMRIGLSTTATGVSDPCGSSTETANFQDIKIKVLNCEDPADLTAAQASNGSAQLDVDFNVELSSLDISYVIAKAQSPFDNPFDNNQYDDVDDWLTQKNATATTATMSGALNGSGNYDHSFSVTVDSEGNSLTLGSYYAIALKRSCTAPNWVQYESSQGGNVVELIDPNGPDYGGSDFTITSHTHTQTFTQTQQGSSAPSNTLVLPVGEALSVKTTVKGSDGSTAVTPTTFNYFDVNGFFNYSPSSGTPPTFILGTINSTAASGLGQTALAVANTNEVVYSVNPSSPTAYWLTYTFAELATGGQPLDAYGLGFAKSVNVAWYAPPALNTDNDGLTGCVPGETVTFELDGVTYSGTAGSDGTIAFTSLLNNGNALSGDDLSGLLNGSYSIGQTWTSGGASHTNTNQQLSTLSINAGSNGVTGTAAPGATVTLTIGDETFTTTADATTGIYDFSGTTSSSTAPSTGIDFNTLVPFTSTTAYTINQSLAGYTAAADVTGSILAATSDITVPTISGALALTGTQTTVAGTAEAGSQVYLYDEDGNQLFDASGDPITATADDQGDYSITVDLSTAQISTGSNTFSAAYSSPYTGEVMQVGSTDTDGNTAPLSAAFVDPTVYVAGSTNISASSVIRFESAHTLGSGTTAMAGLEIADGVTVTVPKDGCLDIAGSLAVQGTGSVSLGAAMNSGGSDVESAQLKFTGEYLGPPTLEMNGQLFKQAHTIGSPMKEGFVTSTLGDVDKLIGYDAYVDGEYYDAGESIATQGLGFYAIVGSSQFLAQSGGFDVVGSPMSALNMSLGYVSDNVSAAGSGWNMIANPYTCGWDWGASNPTNVATTFYIYDVANSSWKFWNSGTSTGTGLTSGVIPPLQGIWVQATSAGASVSSTMADDGQLTCASGSSQNGFLKTAIGKYKLTTVAQDDSADYAEMYLLDIAGAQQGFDADYDAWHMNGHLSRGKVYHAVGQEELVLNAMEIDSTTAVDIAFDSDHMNKTYRLELSTEAVDTTLEVLLEDRYEGGLWSLDKGAYVFEHIARPVGVKQTRFELRFVQKSEQTIGEQEQDLEAGVQVAGNTLTIQHPDRYVSYQIFDAQGRTIANAVVTPTIVLPTEQWPNGIYRIVLLGAQTTTVSIVVQH